MNNDTESDTLLVAELDTDTALAFLELCEERGESSSEMMRRLVLDFLARGDNHLVKKSA